MDGSWSLPLPSKAGRSKPRGRVHGPTDVTRRAGPPACSISTPTERGLHSRRPRQRQAKRRGTLSCSSSTSSRSFDASRLRKETERARPQEARKAAASRSSASTTQNPSLGSLAPCRRRRLATQRLRRAGSVQFSIAKAFTRSNSVVLFVTNVCLSERACAAMNRSFAPIRAPRFLRSARISA